ncbi:MAG: hypothetical protein IT324_07275 [Anaerolineae bacterium]|nr:hypothetical protein [Anaerolineae bacterium]
MCRLLRLTFGIIFTLALTIGIARVMGSWRAPVPIASELATCEGSPCLLAVVPGQTLWSAMTDRFKTRTDVQEIGRLLEVRPRPGIQIKYLSPTYYGQSLQAPVPLAEIYFDGDTRPLLMAWMAQYGPPCVVTVNPQVGLLSMEYPQNVHIAVESRQPPTLNSASRITSISLRNGATDQCASLSMMPRLNRLWHGFKSPQRYYDQKP